MKKNLLGTIQDDQATPQQLHVESVLAKSTSSLFWFVQVTDLHLSVSDQERISGMEYD
jgi:hypothetical protein